MSATVIRRSPEPAPPPPRLSLTCPDCGRTIRVSVEVHPLHRRCTRCYLKHCDATHELASPNPCPLSLHVTGRLPI